MPIYRDRARARWCFEFDRVVEGRRLRTRRLLPAGWTRAQAEAFDRREAARLYDIATGAEQPAHTIEEAVAHYAAERVPSLKHGRNVLIELRSMHAWFAGRSLADLPVVCAKYLAEHRATLAPATLRNRISYLRAACRWAWRHHGLGGAVDPGARVVTPAVANARQVYLDRAQMLALARACEHRPTRAMIRVAWYSGMRLSEIERCRPEFAAGVAILDDTKNAEPRHVPIHPRIAVCLRRVTWPSRYVFGYWFRKARAAVGMPHVHAHDLRHSTASELIRVGVDLYTVGAILGHKSSASTKRYAHLSTRQAAAAINRMGRKSPDRQKMRNRPRAVG